MMLYLSVSSHVFYSSVSFIRGAISSNKVVRDAFAVSGEPSAWMSQEVRING